MAIDAFLFGVTTLSLTVGVRVSVFPVFSKEKTGKTLTRKTLTLTPLTRQIASK